MYLFTGYVIDYLLTDLSLYLLIYFTDLFIYLHIYLSISNIFINIFTY